MRRISLNELHALKVAELALDPEALDLASVEAIAGALRRAASFMCPCTSVSLVRAVVRPLRGLVNNLDALQDRAYEVLEAMLAHGDLFEQRGARSTESGEALLVYAAPPAFVLRQSRSMMLLGVASDQLSALPRELERRIEYLHHIRILKPQLNEDLRRDLLQLGLIELPSERWLNAPPTASAEQHIRRLDLLLDAAMPSRDIPGLSILDSERPVRFYKGRWTDIRSQTGRFVGRRAQAFGADLWCYVELEAGHPVRMIDFPLGASRWRGCDEAWYLQMALDRQRGKPQLYRLSENQRGTKVVEFFSPAPMWVRRRLDAFGEPVLSSGSLFAYRIPEAEVEEELTFLRTALWLQQLDDARRS